MFFVTLCLNSENKINDVKYFNDCVVLEIHDMSSSYDVNVELYGQQTNKMLFMSNKSLADIWPL